jgi:hypothetical protein
VQFPPLKMYWFLKFGKLMAPIFVKLWNFIARSYDSFSQGQFYQNRTTCQKFRFQKGMGHKTPFVVRAGVVMMGSEVSVLCTFFIISHLFFPSFQLFYMIISFIIKDFYNARRYINYIVCQNILVLHPFWNSIWAC